MKRIPISEIGLILLLATSFLAKQKMPWAPSALAAPGAAADCNPSPVPVGGQYQDK